MDLEVKQDDRFQRREWRIERVGWTLLGLFVAAGLVGLLGAGPFSWATNRSPQGLVQVSFQRVTHHESDDSITITVDPEAIENGTVLVELTGSWVSGVDRQATTPQPTTESAIPEGVALEIPARPGEATMTITFRAQRYGALRGDLTVNGDQVSFTQFVLP